MKGNAVKRSKHRTESGALLTGLLYDDRGNRMSPTYASKKGVRYPFYVSTALLKGRRKEAGSVARVSATEIEKAVLTTLRKHVKAAGDDSIPPPREMIERLVHRIVIRSSKIVIELKKVASHDASSSLEIPWSKPTTSGSSELIEPAVPHLGGTVLGQSKPELLQAVVRAHLWLKQLQDGTYRSIEDLGCAVKIHPKNIRLGLRLAFLAPKIMSAILHGNDRRALASKDLNQAADCPTWKVQTLNAEARF
jgi:hypothetical protein